jgi:hypothetical protein
VYLATAPLAQEAKFAKVIPNTNGMSLLLLRDAKSVLDSTGEVDDFFRPLQSRGFCYGIFPAYPFRTITRCCNCISCITR